MKAFIQAYRDVPAKAYFSGLSHFALEMHHNILPVLYPLLATTLGITYAQIGIINLVGVIAGTLTQPLFGALSDRWDPRWVVVLSILWLGLWMSLVGFASSYALLILVVGLAELGSAGYHPAGATLARATAGKGRGSSMAIFSVNGNLGFALSPVIASLVVEKWFGLQGTLTFAVTAVVISAVLFWRFRSFTIGTPAVRHGEAPTVPTEGPGSLTAMLLVVVIVGSRSWYQGTLNTFLPTWYTLQGFTPVQAGQLFALMLFSVGIGALIGGGISDRTGQLPVVVTSLLVMMPSLWAFLHAPFWAQLPLLVLIGIAGGASFPVVIVMAQDAWPQGPGLASALVLGMGWLPTGLGTVVMGKIADNTSLTHALSLLGYAPLVGLAAAGLYWLWERREGKQAL